MRKCNFFFALSFFLAAAMIFNAGIVRADVTGSVLGTVHDSSQAVVTGAHITITNVQTNLKQETVSGADGSYRFLALAAGVYKLTVTAAGFNNLQYDRYRSESERSTAGRCDPERGLGHGSSQHVKPMPSKCRPKALNLATSSTRRKCSLFP